MKRKENEREDTREITLNLTGCTPLQSTSAVPPFQSSPSLPSPLCEFPAVPASVIPRQGQASGEESSVKRRVTNVREK